jgi:SAM-dependent methyltransferase
MDRADPYDLVPYPSVPFPQTHPDRLATVGRLYGLETVPPERCRYLELGCGSGMNLLSMAALLPEAQFLGIDLAAEPIAIAQRHVRELGLRNLIFLQGDITTIATTGDLGAFDYIAAHGVYSWVPEPVRAALLALCARHLSAHGVAYISYNTQPGCHMRQMAWEMMRFHVRAIEAPKERLDQGLALIKFIIDAHGGPSRWAYAKA